MIYLDYNATTPISSEVFEAMLPYLREKWGNAASSYRFGSKLKAVIEKSREQVANLLGAHPLEILFTSCGTESNNAAINGVLKANHAKKHLITSATEHSSVIAHFKALEKEGYTVTYLPVDREGLLNPKDLECAITNDTALVSLMWANNETGVLFPVEEIAAICRDRGVAYHCDAAQVAGKLPINLKNVPIDYLSITGHKFNAPKGIGALFIRKKAPFSPYLFGGHQERERRGGTESVPLIVAVGVASVRAKEAIPQMMKVIRPLRDRLERELISQIPGTQLNGSRNYRLSNTCNLSFDGISSESLLLLLDHAGVCASSGSACLADSDEPSHVILAMKPESRASAQALRLSLGGQSTTEEIDRAIAEITKAVGILRGNSS